MSSKHICILQANIQMKTANCSGGTELPTMYSELHYVQQVSPNFHLGIIGDKSLDYNT